MRRRLIFGVVVVMMALMAFAWAARRSDGPVGPFPGGPLQGPVWQGPEPEWGFASDVCTIEVQVNPRRPRSGRTGVIVLDGKLYVPTTFERIKRWHISVLEDPRVILRIEGRLYPRCAKRVRDRSLFKALIRAGREKYGFPFHMRWAAPYTWYWRMDPPDRCSHVTVEAP
jgi:hypothetical protein